MVSDNREVLLASIQTIRKLSDKLKKYEEVRSSDIAVVGVGLRFPGGVDSIDSYWELLRDGRTGIGEVKPDRWPAGAFFDARRGADGKVFTPYAGMLDAIYDFDPEFFGLSAIEAENLDPQQRLLLEVSWAALEDSGIGVDRLRGSDTGIFVGIGSNDYGIALMSEASSINAYIASGNSLSMAAGRLAYFYDFSGPAMAIDTACSSSLVAIHEACLRLRRGDCTVVIAGGASAVLTPHASINFSKARMLTSAADCHTFDARASGYVRGEGCGLLVMKRLDDAVRDGDRIHGVIKGSAVNHDGSSGGLTVPNGAAQEAVIRAALLDARLQPADLVYVEAHGTGTSLGDPIEANALARVFAEGRPTNQALRVGAVKANLGHLEAAAGVAGLIKVLLVAAKGEAPPQRGFETLNPKIDWDGKAIAISDGAPLPKRSPDEVFHAGVSSFGFSGTNAHIVVAGPPAGGPRFAASVIGIQLLAVSAKSRKSLVRLALRLADYLDGVADADLQSISYALACRRPQFQERIAVVGRSAREISNNLRAAARHAPVDGGRRKIVLHLVGRGPVVLPKTLSSLLRQQLPRNNSAAVVAALARISLVPDVVIGEGLDAVGLDATLHGKSAPASNGGWAAACAGSPARPLAGPEAACDLLADAVLLGWVTMGVPLPPSATFCRMDGEEGFLHGIAQAFAAGADIDFRPFYPSGVAPARDLPLYPFERRTIRSALLDEFVSRAAALASAPLDRAAPTRSMRPDGSVSYSVDLGAFGFLDGHRVGGRRIVPASLIIGLMRESAGIARTAAGAGAAAGTALSAIAFEHSVDADAPGRLYQMVVEPPGPDTSVSLWSSGLCPDQTLSWRRHACAKLQDAPAAGAPAEPTGVAERLDVAALYVAHEEKGVSLGPAFRVVKSLLRTGEHVSGEVTLAPGTGGTVLEVTSLLLDGCFQATAALRGSADGLFLLSGIGRCVLLAPLPHKVRVSVRRLEARRTDELRFDLTVAGADGELLCRIEDAVFRQLPAPTPASAQDLDQCFFVQQWTPLDQAEDGGRSPASIVELPMLWSPLSRSEAAAGLAVRAMEAGLDEYQNYRLEAEQVCRGLVAEAMAQVGWSSSDQPAALHGEFGVAPSQVRLFRHFAARLLSKGAETNADLASLSRFPRFADETEFLRRCGEALPAVLRGERDPLDILFANESLEGSAAVYIRSPISVTLNGHLAALTARLTRVAGRKIRIVEIGAGTGGTSRAVFDVLPWDFVESYCYTDVSPLFLNRARRLFERLEKVEYRMLNIEEPVDLQHFTAGSFDIVIAANVLHATRSLEQTMRHVAQLLAPGGYMLLRECVEPQLSADISFGMTPGWWRFEDHALRPDYPLLSCAGWEAFLARCGFAAPAALQLGAGVTEAVIIAQKTVQATQTWLIVHSGQSEAATLARAVEVSGDTAVLLAAAPPPETDRAALAGAASGMGFDYILCLPLLAATVEETSLSAERLYERTLAFCRACFASSVTRGGRLWMLTTGAEAAAEGDTLPGLAESVMSGIVKAAALEHPAQVGGAVDLDGSEASTSRAVAHIRNPGAERYVAIRRGALMAARLRPAVPTRARQDVDGPTLVTGALGGIGFAFAEAAARRPGARVILVGRDMSGKGKAARIAMLRDYGAEVHCFSIDIADAEAVRAMFVALAANNMTPVHVVHAAGVGGDLPVARSAPGSLRAVTAAKIAGSWNLHRYSDPVATKSFIIVSTMLSLWGARDRAHYILANHFADRLAQHRAARGLPALALQLGPVDCGMLDIEGRAAAERVGVRIFTAAQAAGLLLQPPFAPGGQMAAVDADWARLARAYQQTWIGSYFTDVAAEAPAAESATVSDRPYQSLARAYLATAPAERAELVEAAVFALLRDTLGLRGASRSYRNTGFHDLGMDSLLTLSFAERLCRDTGLKVASATLFDHPDLARLTAWINDGLRGGALAAGATSQVPSAPAAVPVPANDSADDLDEFERELRTVEQLLESI